MTQKELYELLSTQFPTVYNEWSGRDDVPVPPFIAYLSDDTDILPADNKAYFKKAGYSIELYTLKNDLTSEERLEALLEDAGIFYRKSGPRWLDDSKRYMTVYNI